MPVPKLLRGCESYLGVQARARALRQQPSRENCSSKSNHCSALSGERYLRRGALTWPWRGCEGPRRSGTGEAISIENLRFSSVTGQKRRFEMTIRERKRGRLAKSTFLAAAAILALALTSGLAQTARADCGFSMNGKPAFAPLPQSPHLMPVSYKMGST